MEFFQWAVSGIGIIIIILLIVVTTIVKRGFEDVIEELTLSRHCLIDIRDTLREIIGGKSYFMKLFNFFYKKISEGDKKQQ